MDGPRHYAPAPTSHPGGMRDHDRHRAMMQEASAALLARIIAALADRQNGENGR